MAVKRARLRAASTATPTRKTALVAACRRPPAGGNPPPPNPSLCLACRWWGNSCAAQAACLASGNRFGSAPNSVNDYDFEAAFAYSRVVSWLGGCGTYMGASCAWTPPPLPRFAVGRHASCSVLQGLGPQQIAKMCPTRAVRPRGLTLCPGQSRALHAPPPLTAVAIPASPRRAPTAQFDNEYNPIHYWAFNDYYDECWDYSTPHYNTAFTTWATAEVYIPAPPVASINISLAPIYYGDRCARPRAPRGL